MIKEKLNNYFNTVTSNKYVASALGASDAIVGGTLGAWAVSDSLFVPAFTLVLLGSIFALGALEKSPKPSPK